MPHAPPSAERGEHVAPIAGELDRRGKQVRTSGNISQLPARYRQRPHYAKERTSSAIASSFSKTEARIRRFCHSR
jgi:hypothetical protein